MIKSPASCPLCGNTRHALFHQDRRRPYYQCATCKLVFVPQTALLKPDEEKARYDQHENDSTDPGYRKFLNHLCAPIIEKLAPNAHGLDFGCGPGPTLSLMFQESGFPCAVYDPFYADDPAALEQTYDFVSCSEAIEHFYQPGQEFERLLGLVKPGGWIGIMTQLIDSADSFADWHYIADETHVCYFSKTTFQWLAATHGLTVEFPHKSVILFQR